MLFLEIDRRGSHPVYVFLPLPLGLASAPVHLTPLTQADRAACAAVRPVLGQDPADPARFVEFGSAAALAARGFRAVGLYRVCESWEEYDDPWSAVPGEDANTLSAGETSEPGSTSHPAPPAVSLRVGTGPAHTS
jgi:hypothetical protein